MPQPTTDEIQKLSQAITEASIAKTTKAEALDKFRAVLLKERKAGAPMRAITEGLAKIGIAVSEETLRTWFIAQGAPKSRKTKARAATSEELPATQIGAKQSTTTAALTPPPTRNAAPRVARDDI